MSLPWASPAQPRGHPTEPDTVPGMPGRVQPPEPHEQGLGTGPAGTQLLPATNKGCLMPGTAGCLWLSRGAWHSSATTTTSFLLPREQGGTAPGSSPGHGLRGCWGSPALPLQQGRGAAHQFSLLMWSPKPGVSMTVSFMRTPFSSISAREQSCCVRAVLMAALPKPTLPKSAAGLELAPREEMQLHSSSEAQISHPKGSQPHIHPEMPLPQPLPTQLTQC